MKSMGMSKELLWIVVALSLSPLMFCIAQEVPRHSSITSSKTDRELEDLKGPVSNVRLESAAVSYKTGNWKEASRRVVSEIVFDTSGALLSKLQYDEKGLVLSKDIFRDGTHLHYTDDKKYTAKCVTVKDISPSTEVVNCYDENGLVDSKVIIERDKQGRLFEEKQFDGKGYLMKKRSLSYGPTGKIELEITEHSACIEEIAFIFNKNEVEEHYRYKDCPGESDHKRFYRYDSSGRLVESAREYPEESSRPSSRTEYRYTNGHLGALRNLDANGKLISEGSWQYNQKGRSTEVIGYFNGQLDSKVLMEMDASDNWVKKILYRCDGVDDSSKSIPVEVLYRKITYFKNS